MAGKKKTKKSMKSTKPTIRIAPRKEKNVVSRTDETPLEEMKMLTN